MLKFRIFTLAIALAVMSVAGVELTRTTAENNLPPNVAAAPVWSLIPYVANGGFTTVGQNTIGVTLSGVAFEFEGGTALANGSLTWTFSQPISKIQVTTTNHADGRGEDETVTVTGYTVENVPVGTDSWTNVDATRQIDFSSPAAYVIVTQVFSRSPAGGTAIYGYIDTNVGPTIFESFRTQLSRNNGQPGFRLAGEIILGADTDGINPLTEEVSFSVGQGFTHTIPTGAFKLDAPGIWTYTSIPLSKRDPVIKVTLTELGTRMLSWTSSVTQTSIEAKKSSVPVTITIGDDSGTIETVMIR